MSLPCFFVNTHVVVFMILFVVAQSHVNIGFKHWKRHFDCYITIIPFYGITLMLRDIFCIDLFCILFTILFIVLFFSSPCNTPVNTIDCPDIFQQFPILIYHNPHCKELHMMSHIYYIYPDGNIYSYIHGFESLFDTLGGASNVFQAAPQWS
jgi:hypothetical protein